MKKVILPIQLRPPVYPQRTSYGNRPPVEKHCYRVTFYVLQSLLLLVPSADAAAAAGAAAPATTTTITHNHHELLSPPPILLQYH